MISSKEQNHTYPQIGEVKYGRNSRAKRLTIRIKRTGEIKITIPGTLPFKTAEDFVLSKASWIAEKINEIKTQQKTIPNNFATRNHTIVFLPHEGNTIRIKYSKPNVEVYYPNELNIEDAPVQKAGKKAIELTYRAEAHEYLPNRLKYIASIHDFKYSKLTIRNSVSRWGSCSSKNNINLSLHLMKLPDHLIDYVLIHELCHTIHKNHGKGFWQLLDVKCEGNAKLYAKEIKKFSTRL
ncbi:MAG: M48 family metallopeptidase [Bacteroidales bacterium]